MNLTPGQTAARTAIPTCPRCGRDMRLITRRWHGNDYRTGWECVRWWLNGETGQIDTCATADWSAA